MKRLLLILALLISSPVYAQNAVRTQPSGVISFNASSTVAVTNTFQSVWAANTNRRSCTIQNNGAASMYVFFGAIASATLTNSVILGSGQSVTCSVNGVVLTDQVSITGTATQAFYAAQQ